MYLHIADLQMTINVLLNVVICLPPKSGKMCQKVCLIHDVNIWVKGKHCLMPSTTFSLVSVSTNPSSLVQLERCWSTVFEEARHSTQLSVEERTEHIHSRPKTGQDSSHIPVENGWQNFKIIFFKLKDKFVCWNWSWKKNKMR